MGGGVSKDTYKVQFSEVEPLAALSKPELSRALSSSSSTGNLASPEKGRRDSNAKPSLDRRASAADMMKTASSRDIGGARFIPSAAGGRQLKCSPRIPWLIKEADFGAGRLSIDNIERRRIIGTGLMGIVRIAKFKDSEHFFALKSIKKDYIHRHNDYRHIQGERETLLDMRPNPFCINILGTFQDSSNLYFALELAVGGELFRRLSRKSSFSTETAKFYAIEIFSAIEYLQSRGYIYRDLKPENVMLDEDGHCKLVDFGFSTKPNSDGLCKTQVGTPAYLSPEQLNGKFTQGYSKIVDWWSLGCLIYELMTGNTPFCKNNNETPYEIYLRVLKGKISFPRNVDSESRDLISQLCHHDQSKRLQEPEKIKEHNYFSVVSGRWEDVNKRKMVPPFLPKVRDEGDDRHFDKYEYLEKAMTDSETDGGTFDVFEGF